MFWFLTAAVFHHLMGQHEGVAWLAGGFVFVGYLTHLVLDELYSVDLMGKPAESVVWLCIEVCRWQAPG